MNPSEPDPTVEPSDLFVPLVPKVDAALHDHPTSELSKESIEELSPEELTQFEGTRRQLELLYKASAFGGTSQRRTVGSAASFAIRNLPAAFAQ